MPLLIVASLVLLVSIYLAIRPSTRIRSIAGDKCLPHVYEDTRFSRFSQGKELSCKFRSNHGALYTMRNGTTVELVLTSPVSLGSKKTYISGTGPCGLRKASRGTFYLVNNSQTKSHITLVLGIISEGCWVIALVLSMESVGMQSEGLSNLILAT